MSSDDHKLGPGLRAVFGETSLKGISKERHMGESRKSSLKDKPALILRVKKLDDGMAEEY
mgnify:CR=1 FL=1